MGDPIGIARILVAQLRKYMREKTPHNNIIAIPILDLLAWGAPNGASFVAQDLDAAANWLHKAGVCQIVMQQVRTGQVQMQLRMTEQGRAMSDDEIAALFPVPSGGAN